jgi:two-component system, sensor histidine kinase PdtaS
MSAAERFAQLPTAAKLFLILTAAILPIGIALVFLGQSGIRQANSALAGRSEDQARDATEAIESLLARNALALRVAANGALASGTDGACDRARASLAIAPGISQVFELETQDGKPICKTGELGYTGTLPLAAPGVIRLRLAPGDQAVAVRVGVIGGMATALVPLDEIHDAIATDSNNLSSLVLQDGDREMPVLQNPVDADTSLKVLRWPIGDGSMVSRVSVPAQRIATLDRLVLLLPVLMWVAAAFITWLLVSRLLIRPLRRLQSAVVSYQPGGGGDLDLPRRLGPATEIQELRDSFERTVARVDESEREMTGALEGQRRLVREVHHRVKNNLQVVASLLNIHGRSAQATEARAAYAGISRRVGALSIVHRNHFAEMEENRGISLRPLLTELAAELRAGAPEEARGLAIDLDVDASNTTQDVAVAVAFLITEIVEFAMLNCPHDPIEISLRRTSELTARLTISSPVLVPDEADEPEKVQFERIVGGLAKQLRSPLDRKLGRYSVDLPVFPKA